MKVHETTTEKNTDIDDIKEYKQKEKKKKRIKFLIIIAFIIFAFMLVYLNRDTIFEPLRGIFSKITTTTDEEAGFPVSLSSSTGYSFNKLGDGFSLLTDTYLYTYNSEGVQNFALQHGYVNPMCSSNSKRVLIYDKGGHNFALYNRTSEIYKQSIESEIIVSAYISRSEYVAVVTSGGQYSNVVYIYDGNGRWLYTHKYIEEKVMQAAFSPDERFLYITLAKSENGNIVTEVVKYEIGKEQVWNTEISDSISFDMTVSTDSVIVITDEKINYIDAESGNVSSVYKYKGTLDDYDIGEQNDVFVFESNSEKNENIVVMTKDGTTVASASAEEKIKDIRIDNEGVAVLTSNGIALYGPDMIKIADYDFDDEYVQFIKIDSNFLLMSGNSIDCKKI